MVTNSLDLAADPNIDLIVVSVKAALHYPAIVPALKAGKSIFRRIATRAHRHRSARDPRSLQYAQHQARRRRIASTFLSRDSEDQGSGRFATAWEGVEQHVHGASDVRRRDCGQGL